MQINEGNGGRAKFVMPDTLKNDDEYEWELQIHEMQNQTKVLSGIRNGYIFIIDKKKLKESSYELRIEKRKRIPFICSSYYVFKTNERELGDLLRKEGDIYIYLKEKYTVQFWFRRDSIRNIISDSISLVFFPISYSFGDYPKCEKQLTFDFNHLSGSD